MRFGTRHRLVLLVAGVVMAAAGIGYRLYDLQIRRAPALRAKAHRQHDRRIEMDPRRGEILDRNGWELATSIQSFSLFAHPRQVQDPASAARLLAPVIDVSRERIERRLRSDRPFVWLRRRLDPEVARRVRTLGLPMKNDRPFGFQVESKRVYPQGRLAVHIVGFAGIDQKGIEGIERAFDEKLRGDPAIYEAVVDGRGNGFLRLVRPPARRPEDVVLGLDLALQDVVERELDRAMRESHARSASAVFLDPSTGRILALANRPTADPNRYGEARPGARRNRAAVDTYEPGSTFKMVTAAAVLERGTVRPDQLIDCGRGCIPVAGTMIRDLHPHGLLSFRQVIEQSSNVGIVKIASTLPREALRANIERFGFGSRTGVELPGESAGKIAPLNRWSGRSAASLAMGYEIAVTPLQMAEAFATVANGGVRVEPRVVLGIRDTEGRFHPSPDGRSRRVISEETARTLTSMLEGVVRQGTGRRAAVPGYRVAGKTGTARKYIPGRGYSDTDYCASFGGFAPSRRPRIAGIVVLDSPKGAYFGGLVAAPVFSRIVRQALDLMRVPADRERLIARAVPAAHAAGPTPLRTHRRCHAAGTVPDVRGLSLREAVAALSAAGYRVHGVGAGYVVSQRPRAGAPLDPGGTCSIRLSAVPRRSADDGMARETAS